MLYISRFEFPDVETETDFRFGLKMTCYDSIYPFGVLSEKGLTQLDFEDITLLCGGNGTGKTTTLSLLAGLNTPYRGSVKINGTELGKIPPGRLFDHFLGVLPQNPQNLFVAKTVREDLLEILSESGMGKAEKH